MREHNDVLLARKRLRIRAYKLGRPKCGAKAKSTDDLVVIVVR
jgi:hypothetical protein